MPELNRFIGERSAINVAAFARECGCSRQMIDYILIGKYKPSPSLRERILKTMKHYGYIDEKLLSQN
jgi:DNA-binding LacI/PurR family transcriptional regulator